MCQPQCNNMNNCKTLQSICYNKHAKIALEILYSHGTISIYIKFSKVYSIFQVRKKYPHGFKAKKQYKHGKVYSTASQNPKIIYQISFVLQSLNIVTRTVTHYGQSLLTNCTDRCHGNEKQRQCMDEIPEVKQKFVRQFGSLIQMEDRPEGHYL